MITRKMNMFAAKVVAAPALIKLVCRTGIFHAESL
jgi:hypothetical protein